MESRYEDHIYNTFDRFRTHLAKVHEDMPDQTGTNYIQLEQVAAQLTVAAVIYESCQRLGAVMQRPK